MGARLRELKGFGLEEGVSSRLLVYVGRLMRSGLDALTACRSAISQTLTDEHEIMDSIEGVVSLHFGELARSRRSPTGDGPTGPSARRGARRQRPGPRGGRVSARFEGFSFQGRLLGLPGRLRARHRLAVRRGPARARERGGHAPVPGPAQAQRAQPLRPRPLRLPARPQPRDALDRVAAFDLRRRDGDGLQARRVADLLRDDLLPSPRRGRARPHARRDRAPHEAAQEAARRGGRRARVRAAARLSQARRAPRPGGDRPLRRRGARACRAATPKTAQRFLEGTPGRVRGDDPHPEPRVHARGRGRGHLARLLKALSGRTRRGRPTWRGLDEERLAERGSSTVCLHGRLHLPQRQRAYPHAAMPTGAGTCSPRSRAAALHEVGSLPRDPRPPLVPQRRRPRAGDDPLALNLFAA